MSVHNPGPRAVHFSVRTRDDSDLGSIARRVEHMLGIRLTYSGPYFEPSVLETTVLGIWMVLGQVKSLQRDAPRRYQLQGRQLPNDRTVYVDYHDIDDYLLQLLERHEPGRWYRPGPREIGIDAGVENGRIQDEPAAA